MPSNTPTAQGHAVASFIRGENKFGVKWWDWTAQCGATGTKGEGFPFLAAGSLRALELCPKCFPGRTHNNCKMDPPVDLTPTP